MSEKKQAYERPVLRKVRLEVKTSVLAVCNISSSTTPAPGCNLPNSNCMDYPRPSSPQSPARTR
jgi:hypothetical protein